MAGGSGIGGSVSVNGETSVSESASTLLLGGYSRTTVDRSLRLRLPGSRHRRTSAAAAGLALASVRRPTAAASSSAKSSTRA